MELESLFVIIPSAVLAIPPLISWNWKAFSLYPAAIIHMIFLAAGPLGEEPGWRGFALPKILKIWSPFWASLILGILWFAWHLPLFLIPTWTSSPMFAASSAAYPSAQKQKTSGLKKLY